jgi:hypothetical protein
MKVLPGMTEENKMTFVDYTEQVEQSVEATLGILKNAFVEANSSLEGGGYHYGIPYVVEVEIEKQFKKLLTNELNAKVEQLGATLQEAFENA